MKRVVYGPVPSRRFGRSLGIDLVPHKVCTLDCLYCQLGPTTETTLERQLFVPVERVVKEVGEALARGPRPDIMTLAGSGEPTLYAGLGNLAQRLKERFPIPLLLITNGTLLWREDVAREAEEFDLVAPSLDAGDEETFRRINRPHADLSLERIIDGLATFVATHRERVRLEVFFAQGINDDERAVKALVEAVRRIDPGRVDLNTAVRPTPQRDVVGVSAEFLAEMATRFHCQAVPIASFADGRGAGPVERGDLAEVAAQVAETLARRPCTLADLAAALGGAEHELLKALTLLIDRGEVTQEFRAGHRYFVAC